MLVGLTSKVYTSCIPYVYIYIYICVWMVDSYQQNEQTRCFTNTFLVCVSHSIHVWYYNVLYTYIYHRNQLNLGKYTIFHGSVMGLCIFVIEVKHQSQELDIESGPGISKSASVQAV